jgi:hypothetical protein
MLRVSHRGEGIDDADTIEGAREGMVEIARQARERKVPAYVFINILLEGHAPTTIEAVRRVSGSGQPCQGDAPCGSSREGCGRRVVVPPGFDPDALIREDDFPFNR